MLAGYKTYIVAALMALISMAYTAGLIDGTAYQAILGILGAGGLATLRAGVSKSGPAV